MIIVSTVFPLFGWCNGTPFSLSILIIHSLTHTTPTTDDRSSREKGHVQKRACVKLPENNLPNSIKPNDHSIRQNKENYIPLQIQLCQDMRSYVKKRKPLKFFSGIKWGNPGNKKIIVHSALIKHQVFFSRLMDNRWLFVKQIGFVFNILCISLSTPRFHCLF